MTVCSQCDATLYSHQGSKRVSPDVSS